jgi:hypothetical protein
MIGVSVRGCSLYAAAISGGLAVGLLSGCSGSTQESQVSGQVTLNGKSIGPGTVVFAPVGGGKPATASVDENGHYVMYTNREVGLGPGKYRAAVSIREAPPNIKRGERPPPGKLLVPERYEDSDKSGLEYDLANPEGCLAIKSKRFQSRPVTEHGLRRW